MTDEVRLPMPEDRKREPATLSQLFGDEEDMPEQPTHPAKEGMDDFVEVDESDVVEVMDTEVSVTR